MKHWNWKLIILFSVVFVIFLPSLTNFFSGDDWFHLKISQVSNLNEFWNFFSFKQNQFSASFYRPLSTQTFFFVFQSLFRFNTFFYHLFVYIIFFSSLFLIYKLCILFMSSKRSFVVVLIYGLSATNFTRLYFLSAFQEVLMVFFLLISFWVYLKMDSSKYLSIIFFILALLSKETAVVFPAVLVLFDYLRKRKISWINFIFIGLSVIYLYPRLFIFKTASGDSYVWDFSISKALNTSFWYTLWSFGAPEFLVDYVSSGFRILPRFFQVLPVWSEVILVLTLTTLASFTSIFVKRFKKLDRIGIFGILLFGLGILPVMFLPWHKSTLELGLALLGFAIFISSLMPEKRDRLFKLFLVLFISLNLASIYLLRVTNYSVSRARISLNVVNFLNQNYPVYPNGKYFEFINDKGVNNSDWSSPVQVALASSNSDLFAAYYRKRDVKVFYENFLNPDIPEKDIIKLPTSYFLK